MSEVRRIGGRGFPGSIVYAFIDKHGRVNPRAFEHHEKIIVFEELTPIHRIGWCCERGLNSRPLPYQGSALPLSYRSILLSAADFCHIIA